jgi:hypothetical protein
LIFANTTPTVGDLAGHVWGPPFLKAHLTADGLLSGWSSQWFAGFPAYRFYMPVPALGVVVLHSVWSWGIALKLMVSLPLVVLPAVAIWTGRAAGLGFPEASGLGVAAIAFLFDDSYYKYGGNIASTVLGEYGYAWSIVFALAALTAFHLSLERRRRTPAAGVLVALAALCHPIGGMCAIAALATRAALQTRDRRDALRHLLVALGVGALLSAFWYVPLWSYRLYTNNLAFTRQTDFGRLFFPLNPALECLIMALAVLAVVDAVLRRRRLVLTIAIVAALFAVGVLAAPRGFLWNARLVPIWHLSRMLLAGFGASVLMGWARKPWTKWWVPVSTYGAATVIVLSGISWDTASLPLGHVTSAHLGQWSVPVAYRGVVGGRHKPNFDEQLLDLGFAGYQRGPNAAEFRLLTATLDDLGAKYGCGRMLPEFDPSGRYGSVVQLAIMPQLTDGCMTTIGGLYRDSSPTSSFGMVAESTLSHVFENYKPSLPYEPLNVKRGVAYLRELGVRYYLAYSQQAVSQAGSIAGLTDVGAVGPWHIYLVAGTSLVTPLSTTPVVAPASDLTRSAWEKLALRWFSQANTDTARPAASGPGGWPRMTSTTSLPTRALPHSVVDRIAARDAQIAFDVTETGVPVLVRESYFPTWHAVGAEGPWRVAPDWMVVVPTQSHVVLHQVTGRPEVIGSVLTLLTALGIAGWAIARGARGLATHQRQARAGARGAASQPT